MKYEFTDKKGWKYISDNDSDNWHFEVIPNPDEKPKKEVPDSLFKYYSLNDNSLDALENEYIYGSDRWQLNDPFDGHKDLIDFGKWTDEELSRIMNSEKEFVCNQLEADKLNENVSNTNLHLEITEKLKSCEINQLTEAEIKYIIDKYKESLWLANYYEFFKIFGIISLTEYVENTLMWAHYASNSGFVLEFDFKKWATLVFHGPYPINYCEKIEQCLYKDYGEAAFLYLTNVKSEQWKYESEWRFLAYRKEGLNLVGVDKNMKLLSDRKFPIDNSVLSITLGSHFFENDELIPRKNKYHIKVSSEKLKVINHILNKGLKSWMIISPDIIGELNRKQNNKYLGFNLIRKEILFRRILANEFEFSILD